MVLDVSNPNTPVLYASSAIDVTSDVISLYDKTSSGGAPAAPPPASAPAKPAAPGAAKPAAPPAPAPK